MLPLHRLMLRFQVPGADLEKIGKKTTVMGYVWAIQEILKLAPVKRAPNRFFKHVSAKNHQEDTRQLLLNYNALDLADNPHIQYTLNFLQVL
jgi:hypothetical protein